MLNELVLNYFLWFLVVFGTLTYVYTAFKNMESVSVNFFGTQKKLSVRNLMLIVLFDGFILGLIFSYLLKI